MRRKAFHNGIQTYHLKSGSHSIDYEDGYEQTFAYRNKSSLAQHTDRKKNKQTPQLPKINSIDISLSSPRKSENAEYKNINLSETEPKKGALSLRSQCLVDSQIKAPKFGLGHEDVRKKYFKEYDIELLGRDSPGPNAYSPT